MEESAEAPSPVPAAETALPRSSAALVAFLAVFVVTVASSAMWLRLSPAFTLGPVAGIAAGLACRRLLDAAVTAAAGVAAGAVVVFTLTTLPFVTPASFAAPVILAMACGSAVAVASWWLASTGGRTPHLIAFLAVALMIGSAWYVSLAAAGAQDASGLSIARRLAVAVPIESGTPDEDLYQDVVLDMRAGRGYYEAMGSVLSQANGARPGTDHDVDLAFAPAFRLPTAFVVMAALPAGGVWLVALTLLIGTVGSVAAYRLARAYVPAALALAGTALVATMGSGLSEGGQLFQVEVWAGAFTLLSVALFVWAQRRSAAPWLMWAAAAAATLAAVTRELAVAYLMLGLIATLATKAGRRPSRWGAWVAGLVAFAAVYAAHIRAVASVYPALAHGVSTGHSVWLDPSALGGLAVVSRVGQALWLGVGAVAVFTAFGILGSIVGPKDLSSRLYLGVTVVGGLIAVTLMHPPGPLMNGLPAGYWGQLVMPTVFAAAPLAAVLLPGVRSGSGSVPPAAEPT